MDKTNATLNTDVVKTLIKELEKEGMQKTADIMKGSNDNITPALLDIMKKGSDTFKENTGRNMTYSEMRQAWG